MRYMIKCECGAGVPVSPSQAGVRIPCPRCGTAVPVPSLRELRGLPVESAEPAELSGPRFALLPRKTLPVSGWRTALGVGLLAVAGIAPLLVALGVLDDKFAYAPAGDPRRNFFRLDNLGFWAGVGAVALAGGVSLLRGRGYRVGGRP